LINKIKIFNPESGKAETYSIYYDQLVRRNKRLSCPTKNHLPYPVTYKNNLVYCDLCQMEVYTIATKERIKKFKALDKWLISQSDNLNKPLNQW